MTAYVSQSLLDVWVVNNQRASISASFRDFAREGRHGEFIHMLGIALKYVPKDKRAVWKPFVEQLIKRGVKP